MVGVVEDTPYGSGVEVVVGIEKEFFALFDIKNVRLSFVEGEHARHHRCWRFTCAQSLCVFLQLYRPS